MSEAPRAEPLPRLCAITDRGLSGALTHAAITRALLAGGARWIQLREKELPAGAFLADARGAVAAAHAAGARIVVNDRVDVALAAGADGAHVGGDDLPAGEARALLGRASLIGVSTHSAEEGIAAARLPVDYVALGPVFATRTKRTPHPAVGLGAVSALAAAIDLPVVAIGGLDADGAALAIDAGAHAVAVISALYMGGRIETNVEAILRKIGVA